MSLCNKHGGTGKRLPSEYLTISCIKCLAGRPPDEKPDEKVVSEIYANYLHHQDQHNLNMVCVQFEPVGYGVFLVGSCLHRPDFMDVDVRCILPDDEFAALPIPHTLNACISEWMRQRTGLPVDFQFQSQTDANTNHNHKRSALGHALR